MDLRTSALSVLACLLPSLVFLVFVYSRDRRKHEEPGYVTLTFVAGMFAAAVAFFLFQGLGLLHVYHSLVEGRSRDDTAQLAFFLAVVGPVEETLKLSAVALTAGRIGSLDEPADGILYSTAAALGFATSENWYAMFATGGPDMGRAAVVPFVHMLFSAFFGWGLGRSLMCRQCSWPVYLGLALAAAYHGLYDVLEYHGGLWHFATMPVVALLWFFLTRSMAGFVRLPLMGGGAGIRRS